MSPSDEEPVQPITPPSDSPVLLGCPVRFFAALLRLLTDRGIIEPRNVTHFCQTISRDFRSRRNEKIGAKSLRNLFDDPDPETMKKLAEELKIMLRYAENFRERT